MVKYSSKFHLEQITIVRILLQTTMLKTYITISLDLSKTVTEHILIKAYRQVYIIISEELTIQGVCD